MCNVFRLYILVYWVGQSLVWSSVRTSYKLDCEITRAHTWTEECMRTGCGRGGGVTLRSCHHADTMLQAGRWGGVTSTHWRTNCGGSVTGVGTRSVSSSFRR